MVAGISSVQFSKNISVAQLSRMSYCTPEATLNPIHLLKLTPETVVSNVFVAQVCWKAVPNTWPGSSKAPVTKCVVCAWNSTRSVGGRAKLACRTFWDQVYVVGQVRRVYVYSKPVLHSLYVLEVEACWFLSVRFCEWLIGGLLLWTCFMFCLGHLIATGSEDASIKVSRTLCG